MKPYYEDDRVTLYHGDCAAIMPELNIWFEADLIPLSVDMETR